MRYDVGLRITYSYATPAAGGRHVLYMTPADLPTAKRDGSWFEPAKITAVKQARGLAR